MHKELGKISKVSFGKGGYQESQFGLFLQFSFKGSGVNTSVDSGWDAATMECSENARWGESDRSKGHDDLCRKVSHLLKDANVDSVDKLEGKPIECTFDSPCGKLTDWRILTEVL
jgi:hypothetical protein